MEMSLLVFVITLQLMEICSYSSPPLCQVILMLWKLPRMLSNKIKIIDQQSYLGFLRSTL